jgi:glycosyltransferase involved in cell wall biosynthesis
VVAHDAKYTVRICYDVKGWAYHRRALALQKYAPPDFCVTIGPDYGRAFKERRHDLVLQLCYSYAKDIKRHIDAGGYDMVLVTGYNVGYGYANKWFDECAAWSDHVLFNNRECWEGLGRPANTSWISNGVDRELFPVLIPPERRTPRVLSLVSHCHRATKGYDDILLPLAEKLHVAGVETDFRLVNSHGGKKNMDTAALTQWYNTGTIYIVASKSEGTPNPALEAASCGCVVVSTRVGNMPELIQHGVNGELAERNVEALFESVVRCQARYPEMATAMQNEIAAWHWRERAAQYFELFRDLIDARRAARNAPADFAVSV